MGEGDEARVARLVRAGERARNVFLLLAIAVPALLLAVFTRQARRLERLGASGQVTQGSVVEETRQGSSHYVTYAWVVGETRYTRTVGRDEIGAAVGETLPVIYAPDEPSLSRPGDDPSVATREAAKGRSVAQRVVAGVFLFFALFGMMNDWRAGRLRRFGAAELRDPATPRRNGLAALLFLSPVLLGVVAWHAQDAAAKGESRVPVVLAAILSVAVLGGTFAFALRDGAAGVQARVARIMRIVGPLAFGLAVLRLLVFFAER